MNLFEDKIILELGNVLLRPLSQEDLPAFKEIAMDPDIWKFYPTRISNESELADFVEQTVNMHKQKVRLPFTITDKSNGTVMGSTCYMNISNRDKRIEIGATWLGKKFQGTGVNKVCKFLLLCFAFEELGYERVELKTDVLNKQSRRAIMKIGGIEEGILRSHTLMHDGRRRDTIYYSILNNEWPEVKKNIFSEFI